MTVVSGAGSEDGDVVSGPVVSHDQAGGTVVVGTSRGDGLGEVLRARGFRWSRNLGAWYRPRSRDTLADVDELAALAAVLGGELGPVDNQPRAVEEVRADTAERAGRRAERLTRRAGREAAAADAAESRAAQMSAAIPLGQPILVDHYSAGPDRRYRARINRHQERALEHSRAAERAEGRAAAAALTAAAPEEDNPQFAGRRIDELTATVARLERALTGHTRTVAVLASGQRLTETSPPAAGKHRDRVELELERARGQLTYWQGRRAAVDVVAVGPETVAVGDLVAIRRGEWLEVVRVNRKSVSVAWMAHTRTVRYHQVVEHRRPQPAE